MSPLPALTWPPSPSAEQSAIHSGILDVQGIRDFVSHDGAGAALLFEGTVRNSTAGRTDVTALEYEVKASMADKIIAEILRETSESLAVKAIAVAHRQGYCALGEVTVVIAVSAAHRDEAYRASRLLIDRIKHEAPIWKREIFVDGTGAWSEGCTACTHPTYHAAAERKTQISGRP